ncbi:hypothetical protein ABW21_db0203149 [Orbilia brochopaga]|nr:hypothetical protein ABW21_db0203149 [Drechslerella brochopaga]
MYSQLNRNLVDAAHECYKTHAAYESVLGYGRFGFPSKSHSGPGFGELELVNKSSAGVANVIPRIFRPTLGWEVEQLGLLEELRGFKQRSLEEFPTKQIYELDELNWTADKYPQIRFQNGNYIHFQKEGLLTVCDSDNGILASTGIKITGFKYKDHKIYMKDTGYLTISRLNGDIWSAPSYGAKRLICQQELPYISAYDANGRQIWKI